MKMTVRAKCTVCDGSGVCTIGSNPLGGHCTSCGGKGYKPLLYEQFERREDKPFVKEVVMFDDEIISYEQWKEQTL